MAKYTAYGRRYYDYKLVIEADNSNDAYNEALATETHKWTQLEGDQFIEVTNIETPDGEEPEYEL